jgi:hypothetical protein
LGRGVEVDVDVTVGTVVGCTEVGIEVGRDVALSVGRGVGRIVGTLVGDAVGATFGLVGTVVGVAILTVGVGLVVGFFVGSGLATTVLCGVRVGIVAGVPPKTEIVGVIKGVGDPSGGTEFAEPETAIEKASSGTGSKALRGQSITVVALQNAKPKQLVPGFFRIIKFVFFLLFFTENLSSGARTTFKTGKSSLAEIPLYF